MIRADMERVLSRQADPQWAEGEALIFDVAFEHEA